MDNLHGWVFTYCAVSKVWCAAERDNYNSLFNDYTSPNVLRSSKIETLIELIAKGKTINKIKNLVV